MPICSFCWIFEYVLQSRVKVARKVSIPTCMSSTCKSLVFAWFWTVLLIRSFCRIFEYVLQSRVEVARKVSIPTCMSSTCTAKYIYVPSHRNRIKLCDSSNWSQGGGKTMTLCTCRWYFPVHSQFTRTVGKWPESEMLRYHARALGLGLGKRGATQAWLVAGSATTSASRLPGYYYTGPGSSEHTLHCLCAAAAASAAVNPDTCLAVSDVDPGLPGLSGVDRRLWSTSLLATVSSSILQGVDRRLVCLYTIRNRKRNTM